LIPYREKWKNRVIANKENGKKGGRPRITHRNPNNPVGFQKPRNPETQKPKITQNNPNNPIMNLILIPTRKTARKGADPKKPKKPKTTHRNRKNPVGFQKPRITHKNPIMKNIEKSLQKPSDEPSGEPLPNQEQEQENDLDNENGGGEFDLLSSEKITHHHHFSKNGLI
jgi:hypothetical protein